MTFPARPRLAKIWLNLACFLLIPVMAEAISRFAVHRERGATATAAALFGAHYAPPGTEFPPGCTWEQAIEPHPLLGFSYHRGLDCSRFDVNAFGLEGPRGFPETKDPAYFTILFVGGSLAEQVAAGLTDRPVEFEQILNAEYESPNGKPFRVLNGAIAGGSQPGQIGALTMFADLVDAVISIEGHVEFSRFGFRERLLNRRTTGLWVPLNGMSTAAVLRILVSRKVKELFDFFAANSILRHSYFCYLASSKLIETLSFYGDSSGNLMPDWAPTHEEAELKQLFYGEYGKYLHVMKAISKENGLKLAVFFPPTPGTGKQLTPEEREVAGDLSDTARYREMTEHMLGLRKEGVPVYSLLGVFDQVREPIFLDSVHFRRGVEPGKFNAYVTFSNAMVKNLQKDWGLKPKRPKHD